MSTAAKFEALIHAGLLTEEGAAKLPSHLRRRLENMNDVEIHGLCAMKGNAQVQAPNPTGMMFN